MDIIEKCEKCKLHECINCEHSWSDIEEIKQKLAEKDKEIKMLNTQFDMYRALTLQKGFKDPHLMQSIRHQVCEEIKAYLKENLKPIHSKLGCFAEINREDLFDKLDQIEEQQRKRGN